MQNVSCVLQFVAPLISVNWQVVYSLHRTPQNCRVSSRRRCKLDCQQFQSVADEKFENWSRSVYLKTSRRGPLLRVLYGAGYCGLQADPDPDSLAKSVGRWQNVQIRAYCRRLNSNRPTLRNSIVLSGRVGRLVWIEHNTKRSTSFIALHTVAAANGKANFTDSI